MSSTLSTRYMTPATRPILVTRPVVSEETAQSRPQVCLSCARLGTQRSGNRLVSFSWGGATPTYRRR